MAMVANGDVLSATIVSVANLIVLFTNTAGANEKIDDRLLLHPPTPPGREAHPGFSLPEWAQKKEKNSRSSLSYPLRAWHKPAQKGVERIIRGHGLL